jgi:hypothetical protein
MAIVLKKATKKQAKGRIALDGPSGSGKTYTALSIATHLDVDKKGIAVIDTENGSASEYAGKTGFEFFVPTMENGGPLFSGKYDPARLIQVLDELGKAGVGVIIVDSLFHFWKDVGGFLWLIDEEVKAMKARGQKPDSFAAWKKYDPLYRQLITAIQTSPAHVICTIRSKTDYDKTVDEKGKTQIKKVGLAPEFREGYEYEFNVQASMRAGDNGEHTMLIGKHRTGSYLEGKFFTNPGKDFADLFLQFLNDGEAQTAAPSPPPATTQVPTANHFTEIVSLINLANDDNELDDARNTGLQAYKEGKLTKEQAAELGGVIKARKAAIAANGAAA